MTSRMPQVDALEAARQRMLKAWSQPAQGKLLSGFLQHLYCTVDLPSSFQEEAVGTTGNRQRAGTQLSYFASLATAAWPTAAGGAVAARHDVQAAAGSAQPAGPAAAASAMAAAGGAIDIWQAVTGPHTGGGSAVPPVDRRAHDPPPAPAIQGQTRRAARATRVSQPLADGLPTVLSPDVIQISSGSSEGAAGAPAAMQSLTSGPAALEDSLTSGRSSRAKRSHPEPGLSAGGGENAGPCRVRRRVVQDSDTEGSRPAADQVPQGSTGRSRAGPDSEREPVHEAELRAGGSGEVDQRSILHSQCGQPVAHLLSPDCIQTTAGFGSAPGIGGVRSEAIQPDAAGVATGRQADVLRDASSEIAVVRLLELVAGAAAARGVADAPRRVCALDCSVMKMPKPIRFKDDQGGDIVPLDR